MPPCLLMFPLCHVMEEMCLILWFILISETILSVLHVRFILQVVAVMEVVVVAMMEAMGVVMVAAKAGVETVVEIMEVDLVRIMEVIMEEVQ